MDDEAKALGLTNFEYAFYTAVANNDSAKELMQLEKLRELAVVLTEKVRQNASIDCTVKESRKSTLRVIVKSTLCQYGYPPDMQMLATEIIMKQAEMIANGLMQQTIYFSLLDEHLEGVSTTGISCQVSLITPSFF